MWTGVNQLMNELASIYYRSNGEWNCPVVVRMPCGGYIQGGPYHSQSVEAFLAHCPGLKVVIPSNAADAKKLIKAAIRDPNPVVFLEHKALYRQRVFCARPEPAADEMMPLGRAEVVRAGDDVTLVGWGMTVCMASEIAEQLAKEGISVEVIDLRTIVPLDMETVLTSVRKTGKVLIAHEAAQAAASAPKSRPASRKQRSPISTRRSCVSAPSIAQYRIAKSSKTRFFPRRKTSNKRFKSR